MTIAYSKFHNDYEQTSAPAQKNADTALSSNCNYFQNEYKEPWDNWTLQDKWNKATDKGREAAYRAVMKI